MTEWSQGYVTDIPYVEGYTREIAPNWINYVAATCGNVPRDISGSFNYIELGCGLGYTSNVMAGSYPKGQFYGVDFNPAHIELAQRNASQWGISNVQFIERSFEELLDVDLPEFDFITLHGVYVWVKPEAQAAIRKFIKKKLKPGGLVYISYNCMPGWSMDAPMRKWLREFAGLVPGDSLTRLNSAVKSFRKAVEMNLGYFKSNAESLKHIENMLKQRPNYMVHEYLNESWQLPYSIDVADELQEAKISFVGSATLLENNLDFMLTKEAHEYVQSLPTERTQQLAVDLFSMRRFRRDVFVRGHSRLSREAAIKNVRKQHVGAIKLIPEISDKIKLPTGEVAIKDESFAAIKEELARGIQTIGAIEEKVSTKLKKRMQVERILTVLTAADVTSPFAQGYDVPKMPVQIKKVVWRHAPNKLIAQSSLEYNRPLFLVNPVSGSSWMIEVLLAAVVGALTGKTADVREIARAVHAEMRSHGIGVTIPPNVNKDMAPPTEERYFEGLVKTVLTKAIPLLNQVGLVEVS